MISLYGKLKGLLEKMGLAASQARLLTITARLADNELRSQTINNAKMRLATQSSQASDEYVTALNNAQLMFINNDADGISRKQALTFNSLTTYSQYNNQYGLVNSAGLLLVSEKDASIFEAAKGDLNKFLELHGLKWDTTFFELDSSNQNSLSEKLTAIYGTDKDPKTGLYELGTLFQNSGMTNDYLQQLYLESITDEASIERLNYDTTARAYYNQIKDLKENVLPIVSQQMFGTSNTTNADNGNQTVDEKNEAAYIANEKAAPDVIKEFLINGPTGSDYNYSLNGLLDKGLITQNTYNYLEEQINSITYIQSSNGNYNTGCMDTTCSKGSGYVNDTQTSYLAEIPTNPYDYGIQIPETTYTGSHEKYTIAGITIEFNVPKFKQIDVQQRDTDGNPQPAGTYWVQNGYEPYVITVPENDGGGDKGTNPATYGSGVASAIENYLSIYGIDSISKLVPEQDGIKNYTHIQKIVEECLVSTMSPGGSDLDNSMINCEYRFIENEICRIPISGYAQVREGTDNHLVPEKSFYYNFALYYFQQILQAAESIPVQTVANNTNFSSNNNLEGYKAAKEAFELYDENPVNNTRSGNGDLTDIVESNPAYLLNFVEMLQSLEIDDGNGGKRALSGMELLESTFGSDAFKSVLTTYLVDLMTNALGNPKYAWVDKSDPTATENADSKAQWYSNLFSRMQRGYKVLENGLANSREWIEYAFESGIVTMEQVDKSYNWLSLDYKTCANIYEDSDNSDIVAKAEAKYNRAMNDIKQKDSIYDLQLKNIDTEHQSLQTEYDSVKTVMNKNIERTRKFDQSA